MPNPEHVNPHNFKVDSILYNHDGFSIAYGEWEKSSNCIAMRWDGETDKLGFPQTFGHSTWMVLPENFTISILKILLDRPEEMRKDAVLNLLNNLT